MGTAIKYPCTAQLDAAVSQAQCRGVPEALRHIFPDRQVRTKYNLAGREEKYPAPQDNQYQDDL